MKNLLFITCAIVLLILTQCSTKKTISFDPEKEKALIMEIIEKNNNIQTMGSKDDFVTFIRKYNIDRFYGMSNDSLLLFNLADSSDQAISAWISGPSRIVRMDQYYPPVIKIFSDGKSGYCFGKYLVTLKRDSSGVETSRRATLSFIQLFEKPDSIWKMGDYMQNIKPIK